MFVLITGGAGYICSHICVEFLIEGHEIVLFDNFISSNFDIVRRIEKISGKKIKVAIENLINRESIKNVFNNFKFDCVVYLAALKSPEESIFYA